MRHSLWCLKTIQIYTSMMSSKVKQALQPKPLGILKVKDIINDFQFFFGKQV